VTTDTLYRALAPGLASIELRSEGEGTMPTMVGHFSVANVWARIDSAWEGEFLERIASGAFKKTFRERKGKIRSLFQHGRDPVVGSKVLGAPTVLREDDVGAYAEVPLLDTSYNRDLIPGIESGQYGQSFRFRVTDETRNEEPEASEHNPKGLPERTITAVSLYEFGPVTFPAYDETDVGLRSMTDEFVIEARLGRLTPEELRELADLIETHRTSGRGATTTPLEGAAGARDDEAADPEDGAGSTTPNLTNPSREREFVVLGVV
jgi:hypothetical protein